MLKKLLKKKPAEAKKTTAPVKRRVPTKTTPATAVPKKAAPVAEAPVVAKKRATTGKKSERLLTAEGYRRMVARKLS